MAQGERQRVRGVRRFGGVRQLEQPGDHRGDLGLVGVAVAGHRGLDLAGGVPGDRNGATGGGQRDDAGGLRGAHHGPHVVLAEHPLDRNGVRAGAGPSSTRPARRWSAAARPGPRPGGVRTTTTSTIRGGRPGPPSITPMPHRVRPGSTPSTRTPSLPASSPVKAGHGGAGRSSTEHLYVPGRYRSRPDRSAAPRRAGGLGNASWGPRSSEQHPVVALGRPSNTPPRGGPRSSEQHPVVALGRPSNTPWGPSGRLSMLTCY